MRLSALWAGSCVIVASWVAPATAQDGRVHLGPLGVTPALRATNIGIDSNVFNDPDSPQQDFTATISPEVQEWLRAGPTRLKARTGLSFIYFDQFASQRSVNVAQDVRWEVPLNRFQPYVAGSFIKTQSRPNLEIDERVKQNLTSYAVGTDVRTGPRTSLTLEAQRGQTSYDSQTEFLGTNLKNALDRTTEQASGLIRYSLTPITKLVVLGLMQREQFDFSAARTSTSYAVRPGVEFAATALIRGFASFGYRKFDVKDPAIPDYSGLSGAADLAYTFRDHTQFTVRADRDLVYSFSEFEPYYLQSGTTVTVAQQLAGALNASFTAGKQWQNYRRVTATQAPAQILTTLPSKASVTSYQAAFGYNLRRDIRTGVTVEYSERIGGLRGGYNGTRIFTSISYEL